MIQFQEVEVIYPNQDAPALDGIDVTIQRGEFVVVHGPCGSGKTTLLKLLHRKVRPTRGRVLIDGRDVGLLSRAEIPLLRRNVVYLHQSPKLMLGYSLIENVALPLRLRGENQAVLMRRARAALSDVGLLHNARKMATSVSPAVRQLTALARSMVMAPSLLLADEPTGDLDPDVSAEVLDILHRVHLRGTTVVMVTHEPELLEGLYKRVIHLELGQIQSDEQPLHSVSPWLEDAEPRGAVQVGSEVTT